MSEINVINCIEVPAELQSVAEKIRNEYVDYFKKQEGYVSSTFYKSIHDNEKVIKYVNTVVWKSYEHYKAVVNDGFKNTDGENKDGYKVLGKGFPEPIKVNPEQYIVLNND